MKTTIKLFLLVIFSFGIESRCFMASDLALTKLLEDIKLYKLVGNGTRFIHSGDLYEHSMWVYYASLEFLNKKSIYTENLNLNKSEKKAFLLAALLHDIGKAGRKELFDRTHAKLYYKIHSNTRKKVTFIEYMPDGQEHPLVGFEYLAKQFIKNEHQFKPRTYWLSSGVEFDFDKLFEELKINECERKLVAILVGIHYEFGSFRSGKINCEDFLNKVQTLVDTVSYNHCKITKKLLHLSMLIQVADVKGLTPVDYYVKTSLILKPQPITPTRGKECQVLNPFVEFGYEPTLTNPKPLAYLKMKEFFDFFENKQSELQPYEYAFSKTNEAAISASHVITPNSC